MLQLLVSVPLNALEQGTESLLLFLSQEGLLFLNVELEDLLGLFRLLLLHLLAL